MLAPWGNVFLLFSISVPVQSRGLSQHTTPPPYPRYSPTPFPTPAYRHPFPHHIINQTRYVYGHIKRCARSYSTLERLVPRH
ncbi:hypothetical protein BGW80DRAFT_196211 [Lactifluus volemus]|nr:hypothetical protein BGW80DRAFT_196211 [Lactifluus volemus]